MTDELPRRCFIDKMSPAELAIRAAILKVEELPADTLLTEAVVLLSQAQTKVADYIDRAEPSVQALNTIAQANVTAAEEAQNKRQEFDGIRFLLTTVGLMVLAGAGLDLLAAPGAVRWVRITGATMFISALIAGCLYFRQQRKKFLG